MLIYLIVNQFFVTKTSTQHSLSFSFFYGLMDLKWTLIIKKSQVKVCISINDLGRMTKMAVMPIYGKNLKESSSLESVDLFQ